MMGWIHKNHLYSSTINNGIHVAEVPVTAIEGEAVVEKCIKFDDSQEGTTRSVTVGRISLPPELIGKRVKYIVWATEPLIKLAQGEPDPRD